jgi:hypothetical protein
VQARARFRPFRSKVNPSGTARPAHASALDSGGAARSDSGRGGKSEIFLHDFNHFLQRTGGNSEASPAAQGLTWPAPMTRARTAGCGALTPPPRDRGSDTVLMSFLSLMQGARTTLGMWRRRGQRDWRTQSKISAPPQATPGIHLQESPPHARRSSRPCGENLRWCAARTCKRSPSDLRPLRVSCARLLPRSSCSCRRTGEDNPAHA